MWMHGGRMWLRGASDEGRSCQILMLSSLFALLPLMIYMQSWPRYPLLSCAMPPCGYSLPFSAIYFTLFLSFYESAFYHAHPPSTRGREGGRRER